MQVPNIVSMKPTVIIGAQWGDEGKGKVTDILAKEADYIVRFQGGNNAGHTIVVGDKVYKLHLLPSGAVYGKKSMIAAGVVVDPIVLCKEIENIEKDGRKLDLMIDPLCHIIMPYHKILDKAKEQSRGDSKIGTTGRGIGPCYSDRVNRSGIRFIDMLNPETFRSKLISKLEATNPILEKIYGFDPLSVDEIIESYQSSIEKLKAYLGDVSKAVYEGLDNKNVLFEGAQGTFLDVNFGTYPYVTSSHTISGGIFPNVGIPPMALDVIGIVKAYTTRVGAGPFPCELEDENGEHLRKVGHEFGTTTGRPRRCGWLDLFMLKYSNRLNGFTHLAITKLDVLSGLDKIKIGVDYQIDGQSVDFPMTIDQLEKCEVVYKEMDGFELEQGISSYDLLPDNAKKYCDFIEEYLGVKVSMISTGPKRSETIFVREGLAMKMA